MIIFRADGNEKIGSGHVMRCLSLADALTERGEECLFVLAQDRMRDLIVKRGYAAYVLGSSFDDLNAELPTLEKVILEKKPSLFIIDSYYVTPEYFRAVGSLSKTVYFDDLGGFAYPVDGLINYNVYGEDLRYERAYSAEGMTLPKLFLGCSYAPLRSMFYQLPSKINQKDPKEILISTGGADPAHVSLGLMRALTKRTDLWKYHFMFLVGAMNQDREEILRLSKNLQNAEVIGQISDMRSLLEKCDLAISAAGSTLYELCACGVPTITYVFADNQLRGAKKFYEMGLMEYCGDVRTQENLSEKLLVAVFSLAGDSSKRADISKKMQEMIDGNGAKRLAEALIVSFV